MTPKPSGLLAEDHPLHAPGLKWKARADGDVPYWYAPVKDAKAGYRPKSLTLDRRALPHEIAAACRRQWADLEKWRDEQGKPAKTLYTISWLIGRYLSDEFSPYRQVKPKTQDDYLGMCRIIEQKIGNRRLDPERQGGMLVPRILGEDVRRWHAQFGRPVPLQDEDGRPVIDAMGNAVMVASQPSRARAAITQFRMLVKYGRTIGVPGISELCTMLHEMRFPTPKGRNTAPTPAQVKAIVDKAEALGDLSIAIATLAQFELTERRVHIIGEWVGKPPGWTWQGGWAWPNYRAGVIAYWQNKRAPVERVFDLKLIPRLFQLIESIPANQRFGAIIKDEKRGKPWHRYDFAKRFREIAQAAGVPDDVWSMDMRAGAMTEADEIDMPDRWMQDAAGHSDPKTKDRYRRNKQRNAAKVVQLRQAARGKTGE